MKRIILIAALFALMVSGSLHSREDDPTGVQAHKLHEKRYRKAEADLARASAESKVRAALFLGAYQDTRFVRNLGRELTKELDVKHPYLNFPRNDPYVKAHIAWALGRLRHKKGLPYLITALLKTQQILQAEAKKIEDLQKKAADRYSKEKKAYDDKKKAGGFVTANDSPVKVIVEEKYGPGPMLYKGNHVLPYSPDVYWSVSDDFKNLIAPDRTAQDHRIRLKNYNYVNLAFNIFDAIGEIYYWYRIKFKTVERVRINNDHVDLVANFMDPAPEKKNYAYLRGAAAIALGKIGNKRAMDRLQERFGAEKSVEVRAKISYAILLNDKSRTNHYMNLLRLLESDDRDVRYISAIALRDLAMEESIEALKEAKRIESNTVIHAIIKQALKSSRRSSLTPLPY